MGDYVDMTDITPKAHRCGDMDALCPAVFRLSDGRLAYRGMEIWPSGLVGPSERIVIIDPAMIAAATTDQGTAQ